MFELEVTVHSTVLFNMIRKHWLVGCFGLNALRPDFMSKLVHPNFTLWLTVKIPTCLLI